MLALAVMLLGLAACSSASPTRSPGGGAATPTSTVTSTAAPGTGSDVCARVSSSTVSASFGGSVTSSQPAPFLGNPACAYSVKGSNLGVDGVIEVANMVIWKAQNYQTAKETGLTSGDVAVAGVGDDAYYDPNTTGLVFHRGDNVYFVLAQFKAPVGVVLDAAKIKADVIALAKTVARTL